MLQIDTWNRVLIRLVCVTGLIMALPNAFYTRAEQSNNAKRVIEVGIDIPDMRTEAGQG